MKDFCAFCEHYIGGGDWNLCCDQKYGLCYAYTEACEKFKEDPVAKRAFLDGIKMYRVALENQKPKQVPIETNADSVRLMSNDELESWYWWMNKEMMNYTDSRLFVHEWLNKEDGE